MPYRNKLYIAFDGDHDMTYYRTLQMWKANRHIDFNFYDAHDLNTAQDTSLSESIKAQLRARMLNSKTMLLLVGSNTRYLRVFVPYEIRLARRLGIPIIIVNLNKRRDFDDARCPNTVKDMVTTVSISFELAIIRYALSQFPDWYSLNKRNPMYQDHKLTYPVSAYYRLGLR